MSATIKSNTLVISGFDKQTADDASFLSSLKLLLEKACNVEILDWVLIKSFRRIISVFHDDYDSQIVKDWINNNGVNTSGSLPSYISGLKAYATTPTSLDEEDETRRLQLPDKGRLWLISPPPSPPVGWESTVESEPNRQTHHPGLTTVNTAHLHEALSRVALNGTSTSTEATATSQPSSPEQSPRPTITRRFTLRESNTFDGLPPLNTQTNSMDKSSSPRSASPLTPSIVVEWDDDGDEDSNPISSIQSNTMNSLPRTELPPLTPSHV